MRVGERGDQHRGGGNAKRKQRAILTHKLPLLAIFPTFLLGTATLPEKGPAMRSCLLTAALVVLLTPLGALAAPPKRTIIVTGEGKASAPPDMATINAGVVSQSIN